jgi:hypothetical protein
VPAPTQRLVGRIARDFDPPRVPDVVRCLDDLAEKDYCRQDPERVQAALVLAAAGDYRRFVSMVTLLRTDFRDALLAGGLGHGDWPERLDAELGAPRE